MALAKKIFDKAENTPFFLFYSAINRRSVFKSVLAFSSTFWKQSQ